MSPWITLSQSPTDSLIVAPLTEPDFVAGFVLEGSSPYGRDEIVVTREEMLALLHQLPTADLLAVLEVRGVLPSRPALGEVCACAQEAGVHVATGRCVAGRESHV